MNDFYIIDVVKPCEIAETAALAEQIWTRHYTPIIGAEQVAYMLARFQSEGAIMQQLADGYRYALALSDRQGKPEAIGYCATHFDVTDNRIFLSKLYVTDTCRRRGVASALLAYALREHEGLSAEAVWLTVNKYNEQAIAAYRRMGFTVKNSIVTDIGGGYVMDDYVMEMILSKPGSRVL